MKKALVIFVIFLGTSLFYHSSVIAQSTTFKNVTLINSSDSTYSYSFSITQPFDDYAKEFFITKMRNLIQYQISNIQIIENRTISFRSRGMIYPETISAILNSISRQINPSDIE